MHGNRPNACLCVDGLCVFFVPSPPAGKSPMLSQLPGNRTNFDTRLVDGQRRILRRSYFCSSVLGSILKGSLSTGQTKTCALVVLRTQHGRCPKPQLSGGTREAVVLSLSVLSMGICRAPFQNCGVLLASLQNPPRTLNKDTNILKSRNRTGRKPNTKSEWLARLPPLIWSSRRGTVLSWNSSWQASHRKLQFGWMKPCGWTPYDSMVQKRID